MNDLFSCGNCFPPFGVGLLYQFDEKYKKSMLDGDDNNDEDNGDLNLLWTCFIVEKE